jgi:hypothetical protein
MHHLHILDFDSCGFTELLELVCCEIRTQVSDDSVWEAEPMQDFTKEVDCSMRSKLGDWLVLDPLCELVDGYHLLSP